LQRAEFVKQQLIENGISPSRLSAVGRGGTNPIVSARDVTNRWKNRRVEFILDKKQ
jgi:outer membrane protein OmpA-like peptidoglycan-associated protein